MKNILPILALLLSVSGIAVSLGREEVRCHLGLESAACPSQENQDTTDNTPADSPATEEKITSPETTRNSEPAPEVSPSPDTPVEFTTIPEDNPSPETEAENSPPTETKAEEKGSGSENSHDVNPSQDRNTESIPLEVIPPQP
jgi:hypothetical protein